MSKTAHRHARDAEQASLLKVAGTPPDTINGIFQLATDGLVLEKIGLVAEFRRWLAGVDSSLSVQVRDFPVNLLSPVHEASLQPEARSQIGSQRMDPDPCEDSCPVSGLIEPV